MDRSNNGVPEELQLRFEIVKHIIDYRLKQNEEARAKVDKAAKKQRLLGILAEKETEGLKAASAEELRKMIEELG